MAELKTKKTAGDVDAWVSSLTDERRRADTTALLSLMKKATGQPPALWGASIVGFGSRTLVYPDGRELPWFVVGFSPRKAALTIYGLGEVTARHLTALGKPASRKGGCVYLRTLEGVDLGTLSTLVKATMRRAATPAPTAGKRAPAKRRATTRR